MSYNEFEYKITAAGRVNLIGEHVDYCGGRVMPIALGMNNTVYVRPNGSNVINLSWTTLPDKVTLDLNKLDSYRGLKYGNYQAGSALMWQQAGHKLAGCDMLQDCTVPFGSGLSSSAAIEVSTIAALAAVAGEKFDPVEVALTAQKAEREYAGVNCGIMDQYASACGKKGNAMLLDCATLNCEYVPVHLGDCSLVVANCKKPHNLVTSKYNERRQQTEHALSLLRTKIDISCLAELSVADYEKYSGLFDEVVSRRVRHVVEECERVRLSEIALKSGDTVTLGKLLNASHESLKNLFEVTGAELDALAYAAQSYNGCLGSRMTGGGFGGCTISIVKTDCVDGFINHVREKYFAATGYKAEFYGVEIADGITVSKL